MKKINFAGGEPFLYPKYLGELVDYCKEDLHLESVSIITNGSLVREEWVRQHAKNIDILACSCDSFDEDTNIQIGRGTGNQVEILYRIAEWCRESEIKFKLNTVVTRLNYEEDMNEHINDLDPFRWKVFQVLIVEGEVSFFFFLMSDFAIYISWPNMTADARGRMTRKRPYVTLESLPLQTNSLKFSATSITITNRLSQSPTDSWRRRIC